MIDVGTQRLKHLAGLLGGQGGRSHQGLGQLPGATGLCGQTGALSDGMSQHDGQARRGKGDQGVDGDPQRIQFGPAGAELVISPGCDAADPQGGGDACDHIGVAS